MKKNWALVITILIIASCKKNSDVIPPPIVPPVTFTTQTVSVNGAVGYAFYNLPASPAVRISFTAPVNPLSLSAGITLTNDTSTLTYTATFSQGDSVVILQPTMPLRSISRYAFNVSSNVLSKAGSRLGNYFNVTLVTAIDSTDKFPRITDSALLTLVQQQTFKYFWDFGHPVSGLARERNTSGDVVTTGGSGFGIMAMIVGVQRNFISRADAITRLTTILDFLTNKATRYHGAFSHWINGATGATVPFSAQDDGADLVETSFLMQGLLTARQFFNGASADETSLRASINNLWNGVEWNWFRQNGQNVLNWLWSPNVGFFVNLHVSGWNEALIVYALAASSPIDSNRIPKIVYDNGWARNGDIRNGNTYYGVVLPLGQFDGDPLFFAHYSFLGINPRGLSDAYANYEDQNEADTRINYNYCVLDPAGFNGYSNACWGLTASDDNSTGYFAHSPGNDYGVITPTAAISSIVYTPTESLNALRFFYYKLGDHMWGQYGFVDAINLTYVWFASSYLAIDQGPQIVMIENYRSGLLWNLFMSCPEVKTGMKSLGFQSVNLN